MNTRPGRRRSRRDGGSATVELAMAMPAIVLVLGLIAGAAAWGQRVRPSIARHRERKLDAAPPSWLVCAV